MKTKKALVKVLIGILCLGMLTSILPVSVFATSTNYNKDYQTDTHTVFKHMEQTLAPGITNYTNYAYSSDSKQMVYYVTTADLTRDDVVAQVAYKDMQCDEYGMDKLSNMVACANSKYTNPTDPHYISNYYSVVSACNGDGYNMTTGEPGGVFIMGGQVKKDWNKKSNPVFLAILNDGSAVINNTQESWDDCKTTGIKEAIDIFGSNLVWDGKDVTANTSGSYNTDRHSRTTVGITADGKLVICVLDGRQEPFSCGGSMHELAQIMLEAGCVRAFNLDGGGSTTFMAKNEGSNACTIQNRPSDGSERSISNGIIIASTAVPSDTFDHVSMVANDEYLTVGSKTTVKISGVSPAGTSAVIPQDITYHVENGIFNDGVLTATNIGNVVVTAKQGNSVVGSMTVNCVIPEAIKFSSERITVPYGKTAELELIATYGLNNVVYNASNFNFTLANQDAGTFDGLKFTACEESSKITGSEITATFVGTELTAESELVFGKGSEVLFDFEDGTTNGFNIGNGAYNYYLPNSDTFVADKTNGKVHSGNYSLGINIDYSNSQESGYVMTALYRMNPSGQNKSYTFPSANKLGCWIYIPDEYVGLWARWLLCPIDDIKEDGTCSISSSSIPSNTMDDTDGGTGVVYSFNESGWHYLSCDFSQYKGATFIDGYYCIQFYISDRDGSAYNYYAKNAIDINGAFTVYIDDITVDYSSVVDDREAPIFSGVSYATNGMSDAAVLNNDASVNANQIDFSAAVAENTKKANATGIDALSAKAYVDGNEVKCTYSNGNIAVDKTVFMTAGQHTMKFSICDKQGNYASIIRNVNITSGNESAVKIVAHDKTLDRILFGSLYYVDVVAENPAEIDTITTTLNLDSMNKWELDHMNVAHGFKATYTYEKADKIVHLTITKEDKQAITDNKVLVSIPVRVWELKNAGSKIGGGGILPENNKYTYSWFKNGNEYWKVAVNVRIQQGNVIFDNGENESFSGKNVYCDTEAWAIQKFMVETQEGRDYKAAWNGGNIPNPHPIDDLAPTCTEDGYTNRTFCDTTNSIIDWGTTIPATGHHFEFVDGVLKCTVCGELYNGEYEGVHYTNGVPESGWVGDYYYVNGEKVKGVQLIGDYYYDFGDKGMCTGKYTGPVYIDDSMYYAKVGILSSGWINTSDDKYIYCSPVTLKAVDGIVSIGGHSYEFKNSILVQGAWADTSAGKKYYWAGHSVHDAWMTIDGSDYYFNTSSIMLKGFAKIRLSTSSIKDYLFAENGALIKMTGIYHNTDGNVYYLQDGECMYEGLVKDLDGNYYYINSAKKAIRSSSYIVTKTNGLMAQGKYEFDDNGKMIIVLPLNGLVTDKNGDVRYYVDDVAIYAGLVKDLDGNYYYINSAKKAIRSSSYIVTKTNGLMAQGKYEFDENGKMIIVLPLNGLVTDKNGDVRYYVDDVAIYAGLVKDIDGNYYYINSAKKAIRSSSYIVSKTNGLMAEGKYEFDDNGKMIIVLPLNGLVTDKNGDVRYYVDDVAIYAGLVKDLDGNYYYINSAKKAIRSSSYIVSKTNGLLAEGKYEFDENGKMIID